MEMNEYQCIAEQFAVFEDPMYPQVSLVIEAAEYCDLFVKPMMRGDAVDIDQKEVISEAGDVLWNLAVSLKRQNVTLEQVAQYNIDKLTDRRSRGKIKGSGGNR